jgi:hypothetical protein
VGLVANNDDDGAIVVVPQNDYRGYIEMVRDVPMNIVRRINRYVWHSGVERNAVLRNDADVVLFLQEMFQRFLHTHRPFMPYRPSNAQVAPEIGNVVVAPEGVPWTGPYRAWLRRQMEEIRNTTLLLLPPPAPVVDIVTGVKPTTPVPNVVPIVTEAFHNVTTVVPTPFTQALGNLAAPTSFHNRRLDKTKKDILNDRITTLRVIGIDYGWAVQDQNQTEYWKLIIKAIGDAPFDNPVLLKSILSNYNLKSRKQFPGSISLSRLFKTKL